MALSKARFFQGVLVARCLKDRFLSRSDSNRTLFLCISLKCFVTVFLFERRHKTRAELCSTLEEEFLLEQRLLMKLLAVGQRTRVQTTYSFVKCNLFIIPKSDLRAPSTIVFTPLNMLSNEPVDFRVRLGT